MQLSAFSHRRLIGAAALACAAALIPAAALAATTSPAAPAVAANTAATVPAGFLPAWSSFYSPASGVVLGGVGCTGGPACQARLAATTDAGARWHPVTAPDVLLFNQAGYLYGQASRVSGVVFASPRDGWLYGPALYATHDGGARWSRLSPGGRIDTMAVSAATAYAVVSPPGGKPEQLFASPAGTNAWARVGAMTARRALLAVSGKAAWFAQGTIDAGSTYVWATADGTHWHKYPFQCPKSGLGTGTVDYGLSSVAAASPADVVFSCTGGEAMHFSDKEVLASANGGKTVHLTGRPPTLGIGGVIAVPPHRPGLITLATEYAVDHSANGGKTWKQVLFNGGGASLTSLSFLNVTVGWAVEPEGLNTRLMQTTNAGATWHQVPIPAAPARPVTAYVADSGNGTVTPINTATGKAGKPIQVGLGADDIAFTPNGKTAYVANFGCSCVGGPTGDTVTPINTATNTALPAITVGEGPDAIAITPNGKTAYVGSGPDTVTPINTATNTAGTPIKVGNYPSAVAITPNGTAAYVIVNGGHVIPINTATNTAGTPIKVAGASAIAITPNGKTAYVANRASDTVTPINTATNTAGKAINVGASPWSIAITPDDKTAYVADSGSDTVTPINTATNTAGTPIKVGFRAGFIVFAPNGKTAYVDGFGSNVTPIQVATGKPGQTIKIRDGAYRIAITPSGKTVYVISGTGVVPISTATNKAGHAIALAGASYIAITP
jgi:YVTN family beta-propeller protein